MNINFSYSGNPEFILIIALTLRWIVQEEKAPDRKLSEWAVDINLLEGTRAVASLTSSVMMTAL